MRPDPQFVNVSDPDLLHLVCTAEDDHAPYQEFVRRFHPELKQSCKRKCILQELDPHIGETVAHDVFERIRKYKTFKKDHFTGGNGHIWILAYLNRAATNLFIDHHNQQKRNEELSENYLSELRTEAKAIDPEQLHEIRDRTAAALKKLTSKELAVVLADLEYKRHTKYLPDDVTLALATRLGVKPDSIRKIRERAAKKIKQAMHEIKEA